MFYVRLYCVFAIKVNIIWYLIVDSHDFEEWFETTGCSVWISFIRWYWNHIEDLFTDCERVTTKSRNNLRITRKWILNDYTNFDLVNACLCRITKGTGKKQYMLHKESKGSFKYCRVRYWLLQNWIQWEFNEKMS